MELGLLLSALQTERAEVAYYVFSNGTKSRYCTALGRSTRCWAGQGQMTREYATHSIHAYIMKTQGYFSVGQKIYQLEFEPFVQPFIAVMKYIFG